MSKEIREMIDKVKNFNNNHLNEESNGLWANIHTKRKRGEEPAKEGDDDYPDKKQWDKLTEEGDEDSTETTNYMFWQNLKTIHETSGELLAMDKSKVDDVISNGHAWAVDHISTSTDDIEEVYHFLESNVGDDYDGNIEAGYQDEYGNVENLSISEAKYKGDEVQLGKPMKGDVKKFKVYVKDPKTKNIKKVNFGDPDMRIKKSNPARRRSFRARHNCDNPGPRTKARYWSCKKW